MTTLAPPEHPASLAPGRASISRARALAYEPPGQGQTNYVIELSLTGTDGTTVTGVGESQPRGALTGDSDDPSWQYLEKALELLADRQLEFKDSASARNQVKAVAKELDELAHAQNPDPAQKRPYRGTLLGIEVALLDVFARALGQPLYQLLGQKRETAAMLPVAVSAEIPRRKIIGHLRSHFGWYNKVCIAGVKDIERNVLVLEEITKLDRDRATNAPSTPLWLQLSGQLSRSRATRLVREIALSMLAGFTSGEVVVQQPVSVTYGDHLAALQKQADALLEGAGRDDLRLTIQGDESVWDKHSLGRLRKIGGLRAVAVCPAQAGGLLASVDVAKTATKLTEEPIITLRAQSGGGAITEAATRHLALALPTLEGVSIAGYRRSLLDFATEEGPESKDEAVLDQIIEKREIAVSEQTPGLGISLDYAALVADVSRFIQFPPMPEPRNEGLAPAHYEHVEDVRPLGPNGTKGYLLEKRALARGLSTTRYSKSAFVASDGVNPSVSFKWSRSPISSAAAISVCTHKEATRLMLEEAGVPTPKGRTFRNGDFDSARAFVELIGFPVVVKPSMGIRGIGVVAGIEDHEQLSNAFALMGDSTFGGQDFIVEKHINGRDHRILVVGGEVIAAIQRKPASLIGDGKSTVAELLIHRNAARRNNPHLWTRPAKVDGTMLHQMDKLGLNLETVLPEDKEVLLSNTANISQGADSIDVFDRLHPSIVEACEQAVAAIPGMQYCGVDFLLEDPAKALSEQDAAIIELNAHAAIGNCEYPMFGKGRQVAQKLMDLTIDQYGLQAQEPVEELTVHLTVRGNVTRIGFREWLAHHANVMGAKGWARNLNRRTAEAVIQGPTERITALVAACIIGPEDALPTSYQATVIPASEAQLAEEFEVREEPKPGELTLAERIEIESLSRTERRDILDEKSDGSEEEDDQ